jgi:threonyl-tRNA synthetase
MKKSSDLPITITFPDGTSQEFNKPVTPLAVAQAVSKRLYENAVGAKFNGVLIDLSAPLNEDGTLELVIFDSPEGKEIYWHSTSHIMAQAIKRIWPEARIAIGPSIETGFYYDIDLNTVLTPEHLLRIEEEMKKIVKENLPIVGEVIDVQEARKLFTELDEPYKIEIINEIAPDEKLKIYRQGEYVDLCRGPHLSFTGKIKHFKLTSLAGAYWRGNEKNKMLQRIYGVAFPKEQQLKDHLAFLEEAKRRDHRKIGKELDLFSFQSEAPGFVFWHGNGMIIYNEVLSYWRGLHEREGYQELKTPIILSDQLWRKSGHWDHYKENMYFTKIDEGDYAIKPMNCPGGILVFNNRMWSYKDLPVKFAEVGLVHRHEKSGVLHGLLRVRQFTQDDAHVFCTRKQMKDEIKKIINLILEIYKTFSYTDVHIELSTRPEKAIGSVELWNFAESVLAESLQDLLITYKLNKGQGAFYGPKIDFHIKDCLGRRWQCGTVQLDFSMPERLGATFINHKGEKENPVMIHRTILGSIERFIGMLIEQYAGDFPLWLAPEQVVLIPVSEKHHSYTQKLYESLRVHQFRARIDDRNEKVGYKIRENELRKVPYMLVIGDREVDTEQLTVRRRLKKEQEEMSVDAFISLIQNERRLRL